MGADGRADRDPDVVRADEIREPGASGDQPQGSSGSAAAQLGEDDQLAQLKAEAAQRFRALSGDPAEREKLREMLKARRERDGQPVVLPNLPRKGAARPYVTVALLAASWAVFLAQWVPALAQLPGQPGALRVLLASLVGAACPETQLTAALQLDVAALEAGQHLRVATSALLHPGLLPFLLSMDGCYEVAGGLERTLGSAQTLAMLLLVAAGTAAGQYILSTQRFFMAGPGAC